MLRTQFTLIEKKMLTLDVYELIYSCTNMLDEYPKHGQYVMFQLAPGLNRAYSIASFEWETFTLIIKRIPDGRGSPVICDAEIGTIFSGMLPLGHFILQDNDKNKCFIWTGTGFAPVYCQAFGHSLRDEKAKKIAFIFWVRALEDGFYEKEILKLGKSFENFEYTQYFSRVSDFTTKNQVLNTKYFSGYVTDWITHEHVWEYQEYYICGSPAMVKSAREKLETLGIAKEDIFWEQF